METLSYFTTDVHGNLIEYNQHNRDYGYNGAIVFEPNNVPLNDSVIVRDYRSLYPNLNDYYLDDYYLDDDDFYEDIPIIYNEYQHNYSENIIPQTNQNPISHIIQTNQKSISKSVSKSDSKFNNLHLECAICYNTYSKGNSIYMLACGHDFCCECLDSWVGTQAQSHSQTHYQNISQINYNEYTCPCCRTNISNNNLVGEYGLNIFGKYLYDTNKLVLPNNKDLKKIKMLIKLFDNNQMYGSISMSISDDNLLKILFINKLIMKNKNEQKITKKHYRKAVNIFDKNKQFNKINKNIKNYKKKL